MSAKNEFYNLISVHFKFSSDQRKFIISTGWTLSKMCTNLQFINNTTFLFSKVSCGITYHGEEILIHKCLLKDVQSVKKDLLYSIIVKLSIIIINYIIITVSDRISAPTRLVAPARISTPSKISIFK